MVIHFNKDISLIFNIVSISLFVIELLCEFIVYYTTKCFDYLRLGFELDFDSSLVTKVTKKRKLSRLSKSIVKLKGEELYTQYEIKIINDI